MLHVQCRMFAFVRAFVCVCVCESQCVCVGRKVTAVGFEPTPFRNGALSHRLGPLGRSVREISIICMEKAYLEGTSPRLHHEGPCTAKTPTMGSTHGRKVKGFALCRLS